MGSDPSFKTVIEQPGSVFLDGSEGRPGEDASLLFADPVDVLEALDGDDVAILLRRLDRAVADGFFVAGYLTYEAGLALMFGQDPQKPTAPLGWFGIYREPRLLDGGIIQQEEDGSVASAGLEVTPHRGDYERAFETIQTHISEGDVYQVNLTGRGRFRFMGDWLSLYSLLRKRQPTSYGAIVNTGSRRLLSFSPELFFRRDGRIITTRPMKGTSARCPSPDEDEKSRLFLTQDPKNRAENLMIVDLLRNDLSIICEPGSVQVDRLFDVEQLPTVWQMTSDVRGRLREGTTYSEVFAALFPCGSITGAPKRRAMEIIRKVEEGPRGAYCGAIGYAAPDRRAVFNVAIRTIDLYGEDGVLGTGGGIVSDATAEQEFAEMHLKTRFFAPLAEAEFEAGFHLIETMRMVSGEIRLFDRHIGRLQRSAGYFGINLDFARLRSHVTATSRTGVSSTVRLAVYRNGTYRVDHSPLKAWPDRPLQIGLYPRFVQSNDPFLYHKTSRRSVYDRAFRWAQDQGLDEALLVNERGEVTEGTRSSLIVRCGDRWFTPALSCGVLPGVARAELLEEEMVEEAVLTYDDLQSADELVLVNAVRGRVTALLGSSLTDARS